MRGGSSSSPDKMMSMGFAAPPVPQARVCLSWRWQQPFVQHWDEAGAGNARGEQGKAALGTLEGFMSWRAGLQQSQPGFSAVSRLITPGDSVLSTGSSEPLHTDVSPHTPLSRVMES